MLFVLRQTNNSS